VAHGNAEDQADQDLYIKQLWEFADIHDVVSGLRGAQMRTGLRRFGSVSKGWSGLSGAR
jgi:hypothetical protein